MSFLAYFLSLSNSFCAPFCMNRMESSPLLGASSCYYSIASISLWSAYRSSGCPESSPSYSSSISSLCSFALLSCWCRMELISLMVFWSDCLSDLLNLSSDWMCLLFEECRSVILYCILCRVSFYSYSFLYYPYKPAILFPYSLVRCLFFIFRYSLLFIFAILLRFIS